ncbi:IucA/IucC family protein [Actinacidiphila alni]|uniref:IucA/IucC family protein n=1 Tax=Actinacidiphila alni TaxID=380248 RepID=UPI0033D778D9
MTATGSARRTAADATEQALLRDVLSALLREDVAGLRTRGTLLHRPDGDWLRLAPEVPTRTVLLLPVEPDGFQYAYAARLPLLREETARSAGEASGRPASTGDTSTGDTSTSAAYTSAASTGEASTGKAAAGETSTGAAHRDLTTGEEVLAALRALAPPEDRAGHAAFAEEYRDALTALRLRADGRAATMDRLTARHGADPAGWTGPAGALAYETLAARTDHPVHPTGAARSGLTARQLRAYAPEFAPRFTLRWLALPAGAVVTHGPDADLGLGALRPAPSALGLPRDLDASHVTLPVHPLTADGPLRTALRTAGLDSVALLADRPWLDVAPTLSMRTVAVLAEPGVHLKLPLATSTLGLLNRRTIKPGSLTDGAAGQRLLAEVAAREPRLRDRVLHADESRFAHAGHELLAVLVRRHPPGLDGAAVLPLAALLADTPDGRLVLDHLADRYYDGDPSALLTALLTLLFDWQTTLFGYGIALESHQQNISLLLDDADGRTRLRLLFKDDDGLRVHRARLRAALGPDAPERAGFDDPRILVDDDAAIADLFTTITVHLCAGAFAFALARLGRAPLADLLGLVRDLLDRAVRRLGTGPGEAGAVLRDLVLDAPQLPIKAMVSAGTLLTKNRSGATDINKHYTTGPNYLPRSR